jgi:hypothetical protein
MSQVAACYRFTARAALGAQVGTQNLTVQGTLGNLPGS